MKRNNRSDLENTKLLYGAECWAVGKKEEEFMSRTEMRMLRRILGISSREKKNEDIRKKCGVANILGKMREARLRWFGHMMRRDEEEAVSIVRELVVVGERGRGRPRRRWEDCIRRDMVMMELKGEDVWDRSTWRHASRVADPRTVWH